MTKLRAPLIAAASSLIALTIACGANDDDPTSTASPAPTATAAHTSPGETAPPTDPASQPPPEPDAYHLESVLATDYLGDASEPAIELALIPGSDGEAVIALQNGLLYRVSLDGSSEPQPWGDIQNLMPGVDLGSLGEQGLLSLAFSPGFASDGRAYLYYTRGSPDPSVLARFDATTDSLDEGSEEVLIEVPQHAANHNGGHLAFDAEGYLLLSTGDGGGGGDPEENAQDTSVFPGKLLRIDVSPPTGYDIPPGNPFGDEIFAYGLRNPWRVTVDRDTGDIWLGDVGQGAYEEVNRVTAGGNYGWNCYEGFAEYELTDDCSNETFQEPRAVYSHDLGVAVTGGFVYRGAALPELTGYYVYGDFYSGRIWAVNTADASDPIQLSAEDIAIASFAETADGELLIVSYSNGVFRLARD